MTIITAFYYYISDSHLGGVICLSGLNPMKEFPEIQPTMKETPILIMNGNADNKVFYTDAYNTLEKPL